MKRKGHKRYLAGKITKGVPFGRIMRSTYDADKDRVVMYHATKGARSKDRAAYFAGMGVAS